GCGSTPNPKYRKAIGTRTSVRSRSAAGVRIPRRSCFEGKPPRAPLFDLGKDDAVASFRNPLAPFTLFDQSEPEIAMKLPDCRYRTWRGNVTSKPVDKSAWRPKFFASSILRRRSSAC